MRPIALCLALILTAGLARADDPLATPTIEGQSNWPNWRGPTQNNVADAGDAPREWSETKNVMWKAELPGIGGSTPVVWEDRIVVTCGHTDVDNTAVCYDRLGDQLWKQTLGTADPGKHRFGTGANPSPVTDGNSVFTYFKSGDLSCLDLREGDVVWTKNLQEEYGDDNLWWDLGTSPVLTKNAVVVAVMQSGGSYLVALDPATGTELWKVDRELDAPDESNQSYTTPLVLDRPDGQILICVGADHVTAHSAEDGKELWRVGGLNPGNERFFRSIASPVLVGDLVICPYARGNTLTAVKLGGSGDVTESHVVWTREGVSADVPTPAAKDGKVYVCSDTGTVTCLRADNGQTVWTGQLEKSRAKFKSSPVIAGDAIYCTREDGVTFVVGLGDSFELLARNEIGQETVATPVFVDGLLVLRAFDRLYGIGQ